MLLWTRQSNFENTSQSLQIFAQHVRQDNQDSLSTTPTKKIMLQVLKKSKILSCQKLWKLSALRDEKVFHKDGDTLLAISKVVGNQFSRTLKCHFMVKNFSAA